MGNETSIDVLLVASALSPPKITLIGNDDFLFEFSVDRWVFLSFRGYLGEIESGKKKAQNFSYTFFFQCSVLCQGQCFQFSSPNSLERWRYRASGNFTRFLAGSARTRAVRRHHFSHPLPGICC